MYADVTLVLAQHPDAIEVPRGTVYGMGQPNPWVYTVSNGRIRKVAVTTGISDGVNVEITSGLNGHETVVSTRSATLVVGEAVRTLDESPAEQSTQSSARAD
jgi:multidrug efflux pump subunit AcrA (membrane-fusion protein)